MGVRGRAFLTLHRVVQPCQINLISVSLRSDVHLTLEAEAEAEEAPGPEALAAAAAEAAADAEIHPAVIHGNGGRRSGKEYYNRIVATSEQVQSFPWGKYVSGSGGRGRGGGGGGGGGSVGDDPRPALRVRGYHYGG